MKLSRTSIIAATAAAALSLSMLPASASFQWDEPLPSDLDEYGCAWVLRSGDRSLSASSESPIDEHGNYWGLTYDPSPSKCVQVTDPDDSTSTYVPAENDEDFNSYFTALQEAYYAPGMSLPAPDISSTGEFIDLGASISVPKEGTVLPAPDISSTGEFPDLGEGVSIPKPATSLPLEGDASILEDLTPPVGTIPESKVPENLLGGTGTGTLTGLGKGNTGSVPSFTSSSFPLEADASIGANSDAGAITRLPIPESKGNDFGNTPDASSSNAPSSELKNPVRIPQTGKPSAPASEEEQQCEIVTVSIEPGETATFEGGSSAVCLVFEMQSGRSLSVTNTSDELSFGQHSSSASVGESTAPASK